MIHPGAGIGRDGLANGIGGVGKILSPHIFMGILSGLVLWRTTTRNHGIVGALGIVFSGPIQHFSPSKWEHSSIPWRDLMAGNSGELRR